MPRTKKEDNLKSNEKEEKKPRKHVGAKMAEVTVVVEKAKKEKSEKPKVIETEKEIVLDKKAAAKKGGEKKTIWSSGRRKTSVARVKLSFGLGSYVVNNRPITQYFPTSLEQLHFFTPFKVVGHDEKTFDVSIKTTGGGKMSQLDACVHALSRALVIFDPALRPILKKKGLLTRDSRMKERKKYGLRKARRAPQFSKR